MKKNLFVEPKLELKTFAIQDTTLFFPSDITMGENELDPAYGVNAIG